jgi:hypothetical protein
VDDPFFIVKKKIEGYRPARNHRQRYVSTFPATKFDSVGAHGVRPWWATAGRPYGGIAAPKKPNH